ncbi:unnamed protein product [Sordaria macrospora k-hell]|uniref:ATP-dependent (S)-NAD(P)H-hydrate dehydratase n=1 Tax=Sordaria macrospora (strain ATCC MYA-333 / DSM 997 / K(L3346) / K-hell) TaxID=771870 RepID=F7VTE8_SORMK|nr:uncharacterized protein SMAC_05960 [Sordaria macrospora k-hell]CCC08604.1 unnamed protein product [Sordaria macrospora k-hell]
MSFESSTGPEMSATTKQMLVRVRQMVPPLLEKFHKGMSCLDCDIWWSSSGETSLSPPPWLWGQLGRIAVIGGSEDYTGAPYFSAMASARLGSDLSHADSSSSLTKSAPDTDPAQVAAQIIPMLDRLHVLVIGPGLGRDPIMQETCAKVIAAAREKGIPMVLDADALLLVAKDPSLIKGYNNAVVTPNVVEFARLTKALGVDEQGGLKRSGGQGDTLTGSIATFLGWRAAYLDDLWDHGNPLKKEELMGLAVFGGAAITRECSRLAFAKKGRSLQASDLTDEVHTAFLNLFGEVDAKL